MNADDFPVRELEIQFYGGRLDGKKIHGLSAATLLRDSAEKDFRVRFAGGATYQIEREGYCEDGKAYVRAVTIPPLIPR